MNRQRTDEKNETIEEVEKLKRSIVTGLSNNAKKTVEKELKNIFNSSSSRTKTKDNSIFKSIKIILVIIAIIFVINYIFNEYTIQIQKRNLNENNKENIKTNEIENTIGNTNIANDGISDEIKNASIIAEEKANNVNNVNNIDNEKEVSKINNANISVNEENKENGKTVQGIIPNGKVEAKVLRVVDGDTLKVQIADKGYKVRLLGVDTPESVSPKKEKNTKEGKIASEYTKKNLEGKDIILEFDVSPYDRYGRLLAYVYVDGICYNEKLLEEGYAKVMMISPNVKNSKYYRQIEKQAKENNVGFWNGFFK